jgi:hypothetical protein
MNERLEALCEEAFLEVWESRKGPDGLVRTDGNPYIFYEKFAELIVKECEKVSLKSSHRDDDMGAIIARQIKEHFGVES